MLYNIEKIIINEKGKTKKEIKLSKQKKIDEKRMIKEEKRLLKQEKIRAKKKAKQLKKQEGSYEDFYFNYGLNYDLRNSSYNPTSGNKTSFYQELPVSLRTMRFQILFYLVNIKV